MDQLNTSINSEDQRKRERMLEIKKVWSSCDENLAGSEKVWNNIDANMSQRQKQKHFSKSKICIVW